MGLRTMKPAQKQVRSSKLSPSKLVAFYEEFITSNSSSVSQIESALRSITYFIPGRFRESELPTESLHAFIQLLALYHDSLIARTIARLPASIPRPNPTPHERYTKYWSKRSPLYRRVALCLQMIQYTELLWEMVAKRRGEKVRYRVILVIETVKAICRFILLQVTKWRPLVSPPVPERAIDPRQLEKEREELEWDSLESPTSETSSAHTQIWTMPRTGLALPSLPENNNVNDYLVSKVLTADDIKPSRNLLHRVTGQGQLAEVLYILRPLVYAWALQRWRKKKGSWMPWIIGFGMEYGSRQLAKKEFRERIAGGLRGLTGLEREELHKRGWSMGWWILRSGFYDNVTKVWLNGLARKMKGKLLLDMVATVIEDYEYLWDNYHFSTSSL